MSTTLQAPHVEAVVKRGWRRRLLVLAVDQSSIVLALVLAGVSLLILLGTQILAWQWLLAIAAVGIALAVFGIRRRIAGTYRVAQMMDERLSLSDSLSTAWFIKTQPVSLNHEVVAFQLHRAEHLAQTADPAAAFPFERPRSWIVTAALGLLALALFSARYLVTHDLSLTHSFLPLAITEVFESVRQGSTKGSRDQQADSAHNLPNLPPSVLPQTADGRAQNPKSDPSTQAPAPGTANSTNDPNAESAKAPDAKAAGEKRDASADGTKNGSNSEPGDKQDSKQQESAGAQHSNSLMDRVRDALSSVAAKINPSANSQNAQQSQKTDDGQKGADQPKNNDQNAGSQKDAGQHQSAQEQSSSEQQGQGTAKSQGTQGKDAAQPSDKKGSDAQSGVGHSDGQKDLKAAEQAEAMGKLAEIIGKRSASLTGEMQIDPSGKQRLQTDYTHQQGRHSDLGGEINRDEVPLEDQEYIREYMELVRKKPATSKDHRPSLPKKKSPI